MIETPSTSPLLLLGSSVRAAAQSARRAGWQPTAIDQFADVDLLRIARCIPTEDYPHDLVRAARQLPPMPWIYTGALENYPAIIERLSADRPLAGNSAATVRAVRDPFALNELFVAANLAAPRVVAIPPPADGRWLCKAVRSGGGLQVRHWIAGMSPPKRGDYYWQEFIPGTPVSLTFVASDGVARLLGATRQLIESNADQRCPFLYAGSMGPLRLARELEERALVIGQCLARRFELRGLFGVDAILLDGVLWPVEVNPRYTASIEILERSRNVSAIVWHMASCGLACSLPAKAEFDPEQPIQMHGKKILYASGDFVVPERFPIWAGDWNRSQGWPAIADIPPAASRIRKGQPICTVFAATDEDEGELLHALAERSGQVRSALERP